jgi:hypothetical protein
MEDSSTGGTGYQASVNQAKDEPIPASHHDQERRGAAAQPAGPGPSADDDESAEDGEADGEK